MIRNYNNNIFFVIIFLLIILSKPIQSNNLAVIDIESIVNKNNEYIELIKNIEKDKFNHKLKLQEKELEIQGEYKNIQDSKIILNEEEYVKLINEYNIKLNNFNEEIKIFNNHYESQVSKYRDLIINKTLNIIKEYALSNELDLILDSKNYIMASNSINITEVVLKKVNNLKIDINLEPY